LAFVTLAVSVVPSHAWARLSAMAAGLVGREADSDPAGTLKSSPALTVLLVMVSCIQRNGVPAESHSSQPITVQAGMPVTTMSEPLVAAEPAADAPVVTVGAA
jgi:hypothetical protein